MEIDVMIAFFVGVGILSFEWFLLIRWAYRDMDGKK